MDSQLERRPHQCVVDGTSFHSEQLTGAVAVTKAQSLQRPGIIAFAEAAFSGPSHHNNRAIP